LIALRRQLVDEAEVTQALAEFDSLWETLAPREQARVLEMLIERVEYDGPRGSVAVTFHSCGIQSLTQELAKRREEVA
jgi:site-specific DNA recombinase